ncbi:MAG: hypothetical protein QW483_00755 [Nanopusillaceae archaeon]
MLDKKIILYLAIIAFFLSFDKWDSIFIGISNFIFSLVYTIVAFTILKLVYSLVSSYYGLFVDFKLLEIEKSIKTYNHIKKEIVEKKKRINLSYVLTLIFSFLSAGFLIPILFSLDFLVIESKRLGKSKNLEVTYSEKAKIIFLSTIFVWIIFSILKYLSFFGTIFVGFAYYTYKFLFYYTVSSIIPFCLILTPLISSKMGYKYLRISIGDIYLMTKKPFLVASTITLLFLSIFSLIIHPILLLLASIIIYGVFWLRKYAETI